MTRNTNTSDITFALVANPTEAQRLVDHLGRAGFRPDDVSLILSDRSKLERFTPHAREPRSVEGAAVGGSFGAVVGALAAITSWALPGVGVLAAGPIAAAALGAGTGGAGGSLAGALLGYGVPERDATQYAHAVADGGVIVGVNTPDAKTASLADHAIREHRGVPLERRSSGAAATA